MYQGKINYEKVWMRTVRFRESVSTVELGQFFMVMVTNKVQLSLMDISCQVFMPLVSNVNPLQHPTLH